MSAPAARGKARRLSRELTSALASVVALEASTAPRLRLLALADRFERRVARLRFAASHLDDVRTLATVLDGDVAALRAIADELHDS